MLSYLTITHFALIEKIEIHFDEGMTVISGETGSGKSMILTAIGLLMGEKATDELIYKNKDYASIEGHFLIPEEQTTEPLRQYINEEGCLCVYRRINRNRPNITRINESPVSLKELKAIFSELMQFSGQHQAMQLLNAHEQNRLVDNTGNEVYQQAKSKYRVAFQDYQACKKALEKVENSDIQRLDFINFQLDELSKAKISVEEEESLLDKKRHAKEGLKDSQGYKNLLSILGQQQGVLESIKQHLSNIDKERNRVLSDLAKSTETQYVVSLDASETLKQHLHEYERLDPKELDKIEERLDLFFRLKQKYKATTMHALVDLYIKLKEEQKILSNIDQEKERLEKEKEAKAIQLEAAGKIFTEHKLRHAETLSTKVSKMLKALHFAQATFSIRLEPLDLDQQRIDSPNNVQFEVSLNPGESLKPLHKVASGGEVSRIQLALQSIFINASTLQCMIFDEIDAGIGGFTAISVGEYIKQLSKQVQVLVVTHLPQIAKMADHLLYIEKKITKDHTQICLKHLNSKEKEQELTRMVGGIKIKA
ncbi:MAG: AAA family ATPase [bacterium]